VTANPMIKPPGNRAILIISAIAVAFAGISAVVALNPMGGKSTPPTTTAQSNPSGDKDPVGGIGALGRLEPEGEVFKVAPPAVGLSSRVTKVLVKEGDRVKVGQPLAIMDTFDSLRAAGMQSEAQVRDAEAKLAQVKVGAKVGDINAQKATVMQAETDLRRAQAEVSSAELEFQKAVNGTIQVEAEYEKAKWDFERYAKLQKAGAISEGELKGRELTLITRRQALEQGKQTIGQAQKLVQQRAADMNRAELEIAAAGQRLNSVTEVRPTDIKQAEEQVQIAVANVQKAKADFDSAVVKSPIDGQILKIHTKDNESVGTKGLMELGQTSQMYAVAEVDENLVGRVKVGQRAIVKSDAFTGEITGRVVQVGNKVGKNSVTSTDPADAQDLRVVEVRIKLDRSEAVAGLTNLQVKVAIEP
jgi:HlyD family secretion protein